MKLTFLTAFNVSFQYFGDMLQTYLRKVRRNLMLKNNINRVLKIAILGDTVIIAFCGFIVFLVIFDFLYQQFYWVNIVLFIILAHILKTYLKHLQMIKAQI